MTEDDRNFGLDSEMVERMDQEARFSELIDRLNREELGRPIVIRDVGPQTTSILGTESGFDVQNTTAQQRETVVGYALPLQEDNTQHLIVFRTGDMIVTKAGEQQGAVARYQNTFSPSTNPYARSRMLWPNTTAIIEDLVTIQASSINVTHRNTTADTLPEFEGYFETALSLAKKSKAEREQTRRTSMETFLSTFEKVFPHHRLNRPEPPTPPITPPTT